MSLLEVENLSVWYGPVQALRGISLRVDDGEVVALIGSNGAGKSTTLRTISGLLKPKTGSVRFDGRSIAGRAPHSISRMGIVQVPEGRGIFDNLTVEENLDLGGYLVRNTASLKKSRDHVLALFPILAQRLKQPSGTLSGGEQQMLALARAFLAGPRVLLLDEPSLGLAPQIVQNIFRVLGEINREGTTILLVEQNARLALRLARRAYVLETGQIQAHGPARELAASDAIAKAYLGTSLGNSSENAASSD
ncbi:MAG TPA: ABC transporter ATP-binding protein [Planctomycetaceae bacterium]|jgi:branched-chain amino acid transport system ATP-binding protein|nr:ABC transporter ATP-binding protein [Planctomycetaceae bacterium]